MTTLELLITARKKISSVQDWCQGRFVKYDSEGDTAIAWCARGVLYNLVGIYSCLDAEIAITLSATAMATDKIPVGFHPVVYVNDQLGHAAVLKMYDDAIATEKAKIANGPSA